MGGDDSQKLLPWRGIYSSPGRKPPAHYEINTVTETAPHFARLRGVWFSYRLPGSFLESTGGSVLPRAEGQPQSQHAKRFWNRLHQQSKQSAATEIN